MAKHPPSNVQTIAQKQGSPRHGGGRQVSAQREWCQTTTTTALAASHPPHRRQGTGIVPGELGITASERLAAGSMQASGHLHRRPIASSLSSYVTYFNCWRPHRSLDRRAPRDSTIFQIRAWEANCTIVAKPVLSGLYHVYSRVHHDALKLPEDQGSPTTLGLFA